MNNAKLFIISAPSGCGKGTLIKELSRDNEIFNSISCTTRAPRDGELDGVHYNFITREEFGRLAKNDGFLEHAEFSGNCYGTPKACRRNRRAAGDRAAGRFSGKGEDARSRNALYTAPLDKLARPQAALPRAGIGRNGRDDTKAPIYR